MSELVEELERLSNSFNRKMSEIVTDKRNTQNFEDQYDNISNKYLRDIERILEEYKLDYKGKAIEYFRQEFMARKKKIFRQTN